MHPHSYRRGKGLAIWLLVVGVERHNSQYKLARMPSVLFSRLLRGTETNYSAIEHHCLVLVFATQKLLYYFLAHPVNLITRSNPLRYLLSRPAMSGRTARWPLQLNEFDVTVIISKGLRSQALSDLIAQFPSKKCEPLYEELPCEEISSVEIKSGILPLMVHLLTKKAARRSSYMTQKVSTFSYLLNWNFPVPTM